MNNSNVTPTKSRPQYHYFYGSTGESPSSELAAPRPFSPGGSETETLIGESLVHTDEEGTPSNSLNDLQQVAVSSEKNSLLPPLIGTDVSASPSLYNGGENRRLPKTKLGSLCKSLWRGENTAGRVTRIVILVIIVLCLVVLGLFVTPIHFGILGRREPGSGTGATRSFHYIPFPKVDRINYNDPASMIVNLDLFDPSLFYQGTKDRSPRGIGDAVDPILKVPFPTGAFWTNLVLKPTADRGFSYPIVVYPYAYKWSDELLQASYPAMHRRIDSISIRDTFEPDITFTSDESIVSRHITRFDPLSVSARFNLDSAGYWETYMVQGSPYITLSFQKASPIIKALSIFSNFTCPIDSDDIYNGTLDFTMNEDSAEEDSSSRKLKWGVCTPSTSSSREDDSANDEELHGVQFILQTQEGQTWMLFSSEVIALKFDTLRKTTVSAVSQFSGVLRLALMPPAPGNKKSSSSQSGTVPLSTSSGLRRLIYHSTLYPTGAKVSWGFKSGESTPSLSTSLKRAVNDAAFGPEKPPMNRFGTVTFEFETVSMTDRTSTTSVQEDLLMLSLPHHARLLKASTLLSSPTKFDLLFRCVKGLMTPVVGSTWTYDEPLTGIEFDDFNVDNFTMHRGVSSAIMNSMEVDVNRVLPTLDENVYGFGKQVARLAQLAHIGNIIDSTKAAPSLSSSRSQRTNHTSGTSAPQSKISALAMQKLQSFLEEYLNNQIADTLLYDAKFGGVVTRNGLLDSEADFGNGRYNDHHFHYGYMLYACAIMGRLNATFVTEYGSYVDALLFDIAHSSNGDSLSVDGSFFPLARHMSWFDGHSFASGLFPFGNGKSQESSSEAVNAYFGAYLWSMVRESQDDTDSELSDFARLLLAMEMRGAQSYWHMVPPPTPSNSSTSIAPYLSYYGNFTKNYMVGNLGMLDAVCSTWFGTASLYVHMINFLPVTAITSELFDKSYVRKEFENVIGPLLPDVEMAWRGYVVCDHAIVDPVAAWTEAQTIVSYELDAAISKSQVLYWISTRPGFALNASSTDKVEPTSPPKPHGSSSSNSSPSASCDSHPGCSAQGLSGLCCPTSEGVTLSCCSESRFL